MSISVKRYDTTIKDIIDDRYSNKLSTIFVTNKNLDEFFYLLFPSVASRLSANSLFLDFGKTDLRYYYYGYETYCIYVLIFK